MRSLLGKLKLTAKLTLFIVIANLVGFSILTAYTSLREIRSSLAQASDMWIKNGDQFASTAVGGVKWGKADVIRETYALYRNDKSLNLMQFFAANADGKVVDSWQSDDLQAGLSPEQVAAMMAAKPQASMVDTAQSTGGLVPIISPLPLDKNGKSTGYLVTVWSTDAIYAAVLHNTIILVLIQAGIMIGSMLALYLAMRGLVGKPLAVICDAIGRLQDGDLETPFAYLDNRDEMGMVARSLDTFRMAARERVGLDLAAETQRVALAKERALNAEQTAQVAQTQARVVEIMGATLEKLALGDFAVKLPELGDEFKMIERNFNQMIAAVSSTLRDISIVTDEVDGSSEDLASAVEQLSKRTEEQAATLEETAAALDELTESVRRSSSITENTGKLIADTRSSASSSNAVVSEAILAMGKIQESSSQIGQIIGVIDEIAFQTNLLALNAGVEAARAGEAGKGFAVVAQEVRELAQRSANAAKQIKTLISTSNAEVEAGVALVNRTGSALKVIGDQFEAINASITTIVTGYREQVGNLSDVNSAIARMDKATQQNASMAEETNASCQQLSLQGNQLKQAVSRFRLADAAAESADMQRYRRSA